MTPTKLWSVCIAVLASSCAQHLNDVTLGKVVVYRSGVAYFERTADVREGGVTLLVPRDNVDDLLKSLTIRDTETGRKLPVSFPARSRAGSLVRMTIRVPQKTKRVKLVYIAESPAWKPSYRINLTKEGKVQLQGWAIVDNVSGEHWRKVKVGVGSSSALSFRYDLYSIRDVHRQTLGHKERFATAPPTATGLGSGKVTGGDINISDKAPTITLDQDYVANIPVPGRKFEDTLGAAAGSSGDSLGASFGGSTSLENTYIISGVNISSLSRGRVRQTAAERAAERKRQLFQQKQRQAEAVAREKMKRRNQQLAKKVRATRGDYIVEGVAAPGLRGGTQAAWSMANHLRNELIARGISPNRLSVQTRVGAVGEPTTVRLMPVAKQSASSVGDEAAVGESLFVSRTPVTIENRGSSMVSVVDRQTVGDVVYLYDSQSQRGNKQFAFTAVRFTNPTKHQLEAGPVMVYGNDAFVGEGLTDPIPAGGQSILPYALDKQVYVERQQSLADVVVGLNAIVNHGILVDKERTRRVSYNVENRSQRRVTVYVRHDLDQGWKVKSMPKNHKKMGRMTVFPLALKAGETRSLEIEEYTPITDTINLEDNSGINELANFLKREKQSSDFAKKASQLIDLHRQTQKKLKRIDYVAGQLKLYRERVDELHGQIFSLKAVKSNGKLMQDLRERMSEMSSRVQKSVLEIIALKQDIMVERIKATELIAQMADAPRQ